MSASFDFKGKRVLVTGGAKGVGRAIVSKFVSSGASVIALDVNEEALKDLKNAFPSVQIIQQDLLDWDESRKKVDALAPIHHLINNAGIANPQYFMDVDSKSIDTIFGVNFKSYVNLSQVMAEGLKRSGVAEGGTIVNVASICSSKVIKGAGMYCCTKAAVKMLTKVTALELAPYNIRVNCIRPTVMATDILGSSDAPEQWKEIGAEVVRFCMDRQVTKRILTVEETANAVLYLSSDASSFVNGSSLLVDGGVYTS